MLLTCRQWPLQRAKYTVGTSRATISLNRDDWADFGLRFLSFASTLKIATRTLQSGTGAVHGHSAGELPPEFKAFISCGRVPARPFTPLRRPIMRGMGSNT